MTEMHRLLAFGEAFLFSRKAQILILPLFLGSGAPFPSSSRPLPLLSEGRPTVPRGRCLSGRNCWLRRGEGAHKQSPHRGVDCFPSWGPSPLSPPPSGQLPPPAVQAGVTRSLPKSVRSITASPLALPSFLIPHALAHSSVPVDVPTLFECPPHWREVLITHFANPPALTPILAGCAPGQGYGLSAPAPPRHPSPVLCLLPPAFRSLHVAARDELGCAIPMEAFPTLCPLRALPAKSLGSAANLPSSPQFLACPGPSSFSHQRPRSTRWKSSQGHGEPLAVPRANPQCSARPPAQHLRSPPFWKHRPLLLPGCSPSFPGLCLTGFVPGFAGTS